MCHPEERSDEGSKMAGSNILTIDGLADCYFRPFAALRVTVERLRVCVGIHVGFTLVLV
jgi:hypothetical protein